MNMIYSEFLTAPGPKYALPTLTGYDGHDPEATKNRAPAYSLRIRLPDGKLHELNLASLKSFDAICKMVDSF